MNSKSQSVKTRKTAYTSVCIPTAVAKKIRSLGKKNVPPLKLPAMVQLMVKTYEERNSH